MIKLSYLVKDINVEETPPQIYEFTHYIVEADTFKLLLPWKDLITSAIYSDLSQGQQEFFHRLWFDSDSAPWALFVWLVGFFGNLGFVTGFWQ